MSIITVFLWVFLVATMVMVVSKNIKNTNALENDNVQIYGETSKLNNEDISSNVNDNKPEPPTVDKIVSSGGIKMVEVICKEDTKHNVFYSNLQSNEAIIVGEIIENDGSDGVSAETYPWICDISLNSDFWINLYNDYIKRNGWKEHGIVSNNETIRLYYTKTSGKWTFKKSTIPLTIEVQEKKELSYKIIRNYYIGSEKAVTVRSYNSISIIPGKTVGVPSEDNIVDVAIELLPSWEYYSVDDKRLKFKYIGNSGNIVMEADTKKDITINYLCETLPREDLSSIIGDSFVKVHCVNNHVNEDGFYGVLDSSEDISIGNVYYSNEKQLDLCDVALNGEEYAKKYTTDKLIKHSLVKDDNFDEPAIFDEDTQKTITLYYNEEESKWKVLANTKLPIVFNVECKQAVYEGYYKVKHEYYLKDKNNNMILEGTNDLGKTTVSFEKNEIIKVGVPSEDERVDIEVEKKSKYGVNNIEYQYFENSGSIIIEKDIVKEVTLKYVREIQEENEKKIKVEKIWEDENNKYGKRPESVVLQIKNGKETVEEMEVSEEENWSSEFVVPKYDKDGNEIEYTVDEKETNEFYEKRIDGYTVINKYIGEEENDNKIEKDDENNINTSDINIWMYVGVAILSIVVIIIVIILVKKNNRNSK